MLIKDSKTYNLIGETIDKFMCLDLTGVGSIQNIYNALQKHQPGFACMGAAEMIVKAVANGGPVVIATGFPEGGGVPETDGPVGAAMLARALFIAFGVETIILTDEDWYAMQVATCRGAGMEPMPWPESGVIEPIEFLRPVYIRTMPKDDEGSRLITDALLEVTKPSLVIAIERPGMNDRGLYHGLGGRPLDGMVADLDQFFRKAKVQQLPFIAVGDGGNELGMGVIAEELRQFNPKAADTGTPGRGGVAAVTAAEHLVVSNVSNWGATGIIAALSALLENPTVFHDADLEIRSIEACVGNGGVDGMFMAPEPAVDGIYADEWHGLLKTLKSTIERAQGMAINWKGDRGDWRQIK